MAQFNDIAKQERRLAQAQRQLDKINKQQEKVRKLIEQELTKIAAMRRAHRDTNAAAPVVTPDASTSPAGFESQFDQFGNVLSGERLTTEIVGVPGLLEVPDPMEITGTYRFWDRDIHYQTISQDPNVTVYVSGRYTQTARGHFNIESSKEYEYILPTSAYAASPVSVGDILIVPVNRRAINGGKGNKAGHLRFEITDIYTKNKYHQEHELTNK